MLKHTSRSWFHGRISRHAAVERLEIVGQAGAYLVRESIQLPGDYAISFLSYTGHVHHFKINSNCGNYYIGGRQFYALGDLIGFYANCSHILENESLAVPVVPPKVRTRMYCAVREAPLDSCIHSVCRHAFARLYKVYPCVCVCVCVC